MTADAPSRRQVLGAGAALSAMSLGMPAAAQAPAGRRQPNLILFFPDTLRADALSSYGNTVCRTPNLDRLAREGARFENCHVQFPVCGGSRCSLLTGWPTSVRGHRSLTYFLRPDEPNMFRYLRQAGYDVFSQRCRVPLVRKLAVVGTEASGLVSGTALRRALARPSTGSSMP